MRRYERGFETMDLTLDMLIAPDRKRWRWKDEDEFAAGIAHGWYSHEQLWHLKAYGEKVAAEAKSATAPFDAPWPDWRPDPSWGSLELPEDWDS